MLLAACGSKSGGGDGPPCTAVVDHINDLTKTIPGHETVNDPRMATDRPSMLKFCDQHYSADAKTCILASKDQDGLADCLHKYRKPADPDALNKPHPIGGNSPGTLPAPPATGSN